jgi:hypothetical protein
MNTVISGIPANFTPLLEKYCADIAAAIENGRHHDHRRALLMDFLRNAFGIQIDEIELELRIKADEARGRIDAFYKFVIFEFKIDLERGRPDAVRQLKKYFESRFSPPDYIAAVTDGITIEIYDYDLASAQAKHVRTFTIDTSDPARVYLDLDELLAAGTKISPTSDVIMYHFGRKSTTFLRSIEQLEAAFASVESDSAVSLKFREWNALLSKVYGSAVGDKDLFLRHTYLTVLSRAIVTVALFPTHDRGLESYRELLTGKYFRDRGISNLAEPDFFSWALDTTAETQFCDVLHAIFRRLEGFDWKNLNEDLLKMLYQELVDPADRSGLGEYYTPDWLAELVLEDIGYAGGTLLDPSCGSGTFLFCAVRRLKKQGMRGERLIRFAMDSLIGLDVHPVAVIMAKANILLGLASELKAKRDFDIQLRVYMADTLQTVAKATKQYLGVAVGDGREFLIPMKSLELERDLDRLVDQMTTFANRGTTGATFAAARKGFLARINDLTIEEQNLWRINFELMVDLVKTRRDTVWAFILKNAFRPAYIRKAKVDVIVGNPPWLSYRDIAEPSYKARVKALVAEYNLINKGESKLVVRLDTSTLFYVHCQREFLKEGGTIAFVMPKTVVLPSKQHMNFQHTGFSKIHDLGGVTVAGLANQHFFNVKSCVITNTGKPSRPDVPKVIWSGQLPTKNMTWDQARLRLRREEATHELLVQGEALSPYYYPLSLQGATLVPRPLWSVDIDNSTPLNSKTPRLKTSGYAYKATKEEKWRVRLNGAVEREFLFCTVIGEDLLPFLVRRLSMYVLPVVIEGGRFHMVTHEDILGLGCDRASDWVKRAEGLFHRRHNDKSTTAQQYLNYQSKIVNQAPGEPHIVLYNRAGTNISCAYLPRKERVSGELEMTDFIADAVTHYIYCRSESEAHYLVGVLNSNVVNDAIKPYQTEGVYHGKRDIYRRPFEVCAIGEFDSKNALHKEIARLAKAAKAKLVDFQVEGSLAKVREAARDRVRDEITAIDALVARMLKRAAIRARKEQPRRQSGIFDD